MKMTPFNIDIIVCFVIVMIFVLLLLYQPKSIKDEYMNITISKTTTEVCKNITEGWWICNYSYRNRNQTDAFKKM